MSEALLSVTDLRVDYEDVAAVRDVSFEVESGMVYGLIGPNGAGKTSIMRACSALVEASYGEVHVAGVSLFDEPSRALPRLAFMPDFPPLYGDLKLREFLELFASAYGIPRVERARRIGQLLELVSLNEKAESMAGDLSRGMTQRLFLAKSLLHDPAVVILDEPASGLDPKARAELSEILRRLGQAGKAVLVSSHILAEMEGFCNAIGIVERGELLASGRVEDVQRQTAKGRAMRVQLARPDERLELILSSVPTVHDVVLEAQRAAATFRLDGGLQESSELLRHLVQADLALAEFTAREGQLQEMFLDISSGATA